MIGFEAPYYLWGFLGLLLPILIQLWNKRQRKVIAVGSIKLFSKVPPRKIKQLRLSDKRLLLLRMLMIGCLVLLMSNIISYKENEQMNRHLVVIQKSLQEHEDILSKGSFQTSDVQIVELKVDWQSELSKKEYQQYDSIMVLAYAQASLLSFSYEKILPHIIFKLFDINTQLPSAALIKDDTFYLKNKQNWQAQLADFENFQIENDSLWANQIFIKSLGHLAHVCLTKKHASNLWIDPLWRALEQIEVFSIDMDSENCISNFKILSTDDKEDPSILENDLVFIWSKNEDLAIEKVYQNAQLIVSIDIEKFVAFNPVAKLIDEVWQVIYLHTLSHIEIYQLDEEEFAIFNEGFEKQKQSKQQSYWIYLLLLFMFLAVVERWWAHRVMQGKIRG